ncbi:MAG: hypothetical protein E4H13_05070 [Calditrichales bacterium]|nr:MAG: hypothetical protein E4H13_05070 [Calditrichales bacterium]
MNAVIASPVTAIEGSFVSPGQEFEISTWLTADTSMVKDMAGITNGAQITASFDTSFKLINGNARRDFANWDSTITWRFRAPNDIHKATNFSFALTGLPLDVNSSLPVFVSGNNGVRSFALSVSQRQLIVNNITESVLKSLGLEESFFLKGDQNIPLMIFTVEAPGTQSDISEVKLDGLELEFLQPISNETMDPAIIHRLLSYIDIANYQYFADSVLAKTDPQRFIHYPVADTMNNPVNIRWQTPNSFPANSLDTMVVMVSFKKDAPNQSFQLAMNDIRAYDVNPSLTFRVVDTEGNLLRESTAMITKSVSTIPLNAEEAFITYPNPFGQLQDYANIRFWLEGQSDVEIRIFTLVGELVWTKTVSGESRGIHDGTNDPTYRWDGRNDRGNRVLNGVYLCALRIKGAGGTKTFIKKIAYIK